MFVNTRWNEAGAAFLPYPEQALNLLLEGIDAVQRTRNELKGRLNIGLSHTLSAFMLPNLLVKFTLCPGCANLRKQSSSSTSENVCL